MIILTPQRPMSSEVPPYRPLLETLMRQAGINTLAELRERSGLSGWQLSRVQHGLLAKMSVETLVHLANALQLSLNELLAAFTPELVPLPPKTPEPPGSQEFQALRQECDRLERQLAHQRATLETEWQQQVLSQLEPWLLQWPTAALRAQQEPQLPAQKLLPLVRPLANLLKQWQVEAIAAVGETVNFDPQWHQWLETENLPEPGTPAVVRYVGYRQGTKLLYRAQVSLPNSDNL